MGLKQIFSELFFKQNVSSFAYSLCQMSLSTLHNNWQLYNLSKFCKEVQIYFGFQYIKWLYTVQTSIYPMRFPYVLHMGIRIQKQIN